MTDNGLPCLDLLEATPGILRGQMSELTDDDARWKPAPDRFSVAPFDRQAPTRGEDKANMLRWRSVALHGPRRDAEEAQMKQLLAGTLRDRAAPPHK